MSRQRGATSSAVMMAIFAITAVLMLGYGFRDTERPISDRTRCRAAARWAAESAIARGRAQVEQGRTPSRLRGDLAGATYTLVATRSADGWNFVGTGVCEAEGRRVEQVAHVKLKRESGAWVTAMYALRPGGGG